VVDVTHFVVDPFGPNVDFDFKAFDETVQKAQRLMDDLIDLELEKIDEIIAKVRKYVVLRIDAMIAVALWILMTWVHEIATHSPILAAVSVEHDSGKTTFITQPSAI